MSNPTTNKILQAVAEEIDIPNSSYDLAEKRYEALSKWFSRSESRCYAYKPYLYPQGSFRLGTVIRPLNKEGEYDLDMGCRLGSGISKKTHTQKYLKNLVGNDVEEYRLAQGFNQACEEKNRCWRLKYSDNLNFHLDAVPSIPEDHSRRVLIKDAMIKLGSSDALAQNVSNLAGAITDKTLDNYSIICDDWLISNSEGYALWFESQMELAKPLMEKWAAAAKIKPLPTNRRKSPLQKCVQILKRHRDVMFKDDSDRKPISIIITTLAAKAYSGEIELDDAMAGILERMESFVCKTAPYVPNPVNPDEDFADKWEMAEYRHLNLAGNFRLWLQQAKIDLGELQKTASSVIVGKKLSSAFAVNLSEEAISKIPGLMATAVVPKLHSISPQPAKPWSW